MENVVIEVKKLSKLYKIGSQEYFGGSLRKRIWRYFFDLFNKNKKKLKENINEFYALKDINFELKQGEILGIIGQNGAGKTTLLKILSGIAEPTEGEITIIGRVASILEVGTGFHPDLTGRENVYLSAKMLGLSKNEINEKFNEIVSFSGVEKFIDTAVKHYSSGMYLRLAFSVAVNVDADVFLFDEVLNFGDTEFQQQSKKKIKELMRSNKTVVLISHDMNDIIKLCTRVLCLENGKIIDSGDPNNSVSTYMSKIDNALNSKMKYTVEKNTLDNINSSAATDFKINFIRLEKNKEQILAPISINDSFEIHINLEKFNNNDLMLISLNFSNMGTVFLATNSYFSRNKSIEIRKEGLYDMLIEIPKRFFNSNIYDVDIYFTDEFKDNVKRIKSALAFKILPDEQELKMKIYEHYGYFYGPMYTSLNWFTAFSSKDI